MAILGATFFQIFIPLFAVFNFCRQSDFFSAALSFGWLSTNLFEISYYVADANKQTITLVSPFGENVIHDWAYILEKTGLLRYDLLLSLTFRLLGIVAMLFCFLSGIWILRHMAAAKIEKC